MQIQNYKGWELYLDAINGFAPYFQNMLSHRVKKKLATNIVVTGEAGIGKSYFAINICRLLDPKFSLRQIVFTYTNFLELIADKKFRMGRPIVFDEPSYSMGKRDWYRELNKALVLTIESFRFKVHPLFIPIINKSLLDKTVRSHLLQYQIVVTDRGEADVYRIKPSQFIDEVYHQTFCSLKYGMLDKCKRDTCLGCAELPKCRIFRALYEKKKAFIQNQRYERAKDKAIQRESKDYTDKELEAFLYSRKKQIVNENSKLDAALVRVILEDEFDVKIGYTHSYSLVKRLKHHYPKDFD